MRKLFVLLSLSLVMSLAFAPAALGQNNNFTGPCAVAAEQLGVPTESFLVFIPEVNGCILAEGQANPLIDQLNGPVYDADTGENLGLLKDVDPNLADNVTYEEFCGAFPTLDVGGQFGDLSAQQYYDQFANAQEQAILDPNGDGLACTDEDAAFLAGGSMTDDAADDGTTAPATAQYADGDMADGEMSELPDTGGPLLLPLAFGFALLGIGGLLLKRR